MGPIISAPLIILAGYGIGQTYAGIDTWIKIVLNFSYMRFCETGMIAAMLRGRGNLHCPESELICPFKNADHFLHLLGMDNSTTLIDASVIMFYMILFRGIALYIVKQRLCNGKTFRAVQVIASVVKSKFNVSR